MNRIDQVAGIATSSNHLAMALAFLVGVFITRKDSECIDYSDTPGDNVPTTLIEGRAR